MDYIENGCHPLIGKWNHELLLHFLSGDRLETTLLVVDVLHQASMGCSNISADVLIGHLTDLAEKDHPLTIPPEDIRNHVRTIRIPLL